MGCGLLELPVGYRFVPTDEELVTHYLMNKVHYKPLPAQIIQDMDPTAFCSEHPKKLGAVSFPKGEREWYFFIHKEEISWECKEKGMSIEVGDGLGFWKSNGQQVPIFNSDGNVSASKFHFNYYSRNRSNPKRSHWKMEMYALPTHHPCCSQTPNFQGNEWILLKLIRGTYYQSQF